MKKRLGVDIGGVLMSKDTDSDAQFFSDNFLQTPEVPAAIQTLTYFTSFIDPEDIFLISKCSESIEKKTRQWLEYRYFFKETGLLAENLIFCRNRADKARISEELSITHFIDDRHSVLIHMLNLKSIKKLFLFRPSSNELPQTMESKLEIVHHWFWINAKMQEENPEFPLPPGWHFLAADISEQLARRFFSDSLIRVSFIMRDEENAILEINKKYYRKFLDWNSKEKLDIESFLQAHQPIPKENIADIIYQEEVNWFGWPQKHHEIWESANGG